MKKIFCIFITITIFVTLFGCANNKKISQDDPMEDIMNKKEPFITLNTLYVFFTNNIYTVIIEENGTIQKTVNFSSQREASNIVGLKLQHIDNIEDFLDENFDDITATLGEAHTDIGSGFYIPSYITYDGFLVSFYIDNDTVFEIIKRDLLSNTITERVCK